MATDTAAPEQSSRLPNLDILRGLCALEVFVFHLFAHVRATTFMKEGSWQLESFNATWNTLQILSTFAVLGFFVLSGFVITLYIQRDIARTGHYAEFLLFRFTRLSFVCAPAVFVSLVLAYYFQSTHPQTGIWPRYQNYDPLLIIGSATGFAREWNWPGWTLAVEWGFYLTIVFIGALTRPTAANLVLACAVGVFAFRSGVLVQRDELVMSLFMGAALTAIRPYVSGKGTALIASGIVLLIALVLDPQLSTGYGFVLLKAIPMVLLVLGFAATPEGAGALYRALRYVGKISFSLYIWHWPVILFGNYYLFGRGYMSGYRQTAVMFVVYPLIVLAVSHISYCLFERTYRMKQLRSWIFGQRQAVSGA